MKAYFAFTALLLATVTLGTASTPATAASGYNWLQFGGDAAHSGNNTLETAINAANVGGLQSLYRVPLVSSASPSPADGAPVYLTGVSTASGTRNLLYITTKDGHILALDAATGTQVWSHQYGPSSTGATCYINFGSNPCYTTSSPAIDPNLQYVYSYGLDGKVHKYAAGTGTEVTTGGWPETATLKPQDEKSSPALGFATVSGTTYLYVTNGGYPGDNGDYQGHITAINLTTGAQQVFNTLCSSQTVHFVEKPVSPDCPAVQSAVWARAGVVYDSATGRIYFSTGNGAFTPASGYWGDSVLALNPNGTGVNGHPLDTYTPSNYQSLQNSDLDLGSTTVAVVPAPAGSTIPHLGVQGGKDSVVRLLNLDNLSGQSTVGATGGEIASVTLSQGGEILTQPAVWVNGNVTWVFVATSYGVSGLKVTLDAQNRPQISTGWTISSMGTSPLVANGVLYVAGSNNLRALNPTTGGQLWRATSIGGIHWQSPVVAGGVLYVEDNNGYLNAFHLATTAALLSGAGLRQTGRHLIWHWTVSKRTSFVRFNLRAGGRIIRGVTPHRSATYTVTTRRATGPYRLVAVTADGTRTTVTLVPSAG